MISQKEMLSSTGPLGNEEMEALGYFARDRECNSIICPIPFVFS